jgi:hypothetical protein
MRAFRSTFSLGQDGSIAAFALVRISDFSAQRAVDPVRAPAPESATV